MTNPARKHPRQRVTPRRFPIIALVGVDGSGKTTQAHLLATGLAAAGRPAHYWRNAGGRRWFGRLAQHLGRPDGQRLLGRGGMLFVESILRWLAIARALLGSALTGRAAVMDRYAVCQYASIRAHGGHRRWETLARLCFGVFAPPDITFLLAVDPIEAYRRIERRGTDHESLAFLASAVAAYRSLPECPAFVVIDANRAAPDIQRVIRAHLDEWLSDPPAPQVPTHPCATGVTAPPGAARSPSPRVGAARSPSLRVGAPRSTSLRVGAPKSRSFRVGAPRSRSFTEDAPATHR